MSKVAKYKFSDREKQFCHCSHRLTKNNKYVLFRYFHFEILELKFLYLHGYEVEGKLILLDVHLFHKNNKKLKLI